MPRAFATVGISVVAEDVAKDRVISILGSAADYLGGELKVSTQRRTEIVGRTYLWPQ